MTMENRQTKMGNQRIILMELAIEKALQLSPYAGAACVAVSGEGMLISTAVGYMHANRKLVEELLSRTNPADAAMLLLTQEIVAPDAELESLADLMVAKGVREVCFCNEAPGRKAGSFAALLKLRGVPCSAGIAAAKLQNQKAVLTRFHEHGRPWLCCLLAMDDKGSPLRLETFGSQFGFRTQFSNLLGRFPLCVRDSAAGELPRAQQAAATSATDEARICHVVDFSASSGATATAEVLALCQQQGAPAALLLTTAESMTMPALIAATDELVVYQQNEHQRDLEAGQVDLPLLLDGNWQLVDHSPLGDGSYFRYTRKQP